MKKNLHMENTNRFCYFSVRRLQRSPWIMLRTLSIFLKSLSHFIIREQLLTVYNIRTRFTHTIWNASLSKISDLQYHHPIFFLLHYTRISEIQTYKRPASTNLRTSELWNSFPYFISLREYLDRNYSQNKTSSSAGGDNNKTFCCLQFYFWIKVTEGPYTCFTFAFTQYWRGSSLTSITSVGRAITRELYCKLGHTSHTIWCCKASYSIQVTPTA